MLDVKPIAQEKFIPLDTFLNHMPYARTFPYETRLSFEYLLEYLAERAQSCSPAMKGLFEGLHRQISLLQEKLEQGESPEALEESKAIQTLMSLFFPLTEEEGQAFAGEPFAPTFMFRSQAVEEQSKSGKLEIYFPGKEDEEAERGSVAEAGGLILKYCYGQELDFCFPRAFRLRDRETGLEKYYRINVVTDFIRVKALKPLPKLGPRHFNKLINNVLDSELWLEYLPPENFVLEGLVMGYLTDVTNTEVWNNLQQGLIGESPRSRDEMIAFVQAQFRNYLQEPGLRLGAVPLWWESSVEELLEGSLLRGVSGQLDVLPPHMEGTLYHRLLKEEGPLAVEDLREVANDKVATLLLKLGLRSLILAPVKDEGGKVIGILEIGTPQPCRFNAFTLIHLQDIFTLFSISFNRMKRQMQDMVNLTIQKRYTSIHQSVFWKFRKAAEHMLFRGEDVDDNIAFKDVYPLYGQADIVSSSTLRSGAIHADIMDNLEMLSRVLESCRETSGFHLTDKYLNRVHKLSQRLAREFYSSDENEVTDLLLQEVHPFLQYLGRKDRQLRENVLQPYFAKMDKQLGILYRQRKDYEKSVEMLNILLGNFMEEQQQKMQALLPHYYEIYKTDGIEYNIYLGQSILQEGEFLNYHLKDFRLWQLISLCEATRLVEQEAQKFPTSLSTAQLIFVYNSPISIRFRMDDKRFDVDGAYNVRYEIIKKRIDKAMVKDTDERLTQRGKIAIVYLNDKDREEYLGYIDYLVDKGYVSPEVESLELGRLQGADGLKALRVTVV